MDNSKTTVVYSDRQETTLIPVRYVPDTGILYFIEAQEINPESETLDPRKLIETRYPRKSVSIN